MKENSEKKVLVESRIKKLFDQATEQVEKRPSYSRKYVLMARELARKSQIKLSRELSRKFCKNCNTLFTTKSKVKTKRGYLVYSCLSCGLRRRFKISSS